VLSTQNEASQNTVSLSEVQTIIQEQLKYGNMLHHSRSCVKAP